MNAEYELNLDFDSDLSQLSNMDGAKVTTLTKEEWEAFKAAFFQAEEQPRLIPYPWLCRRRIEPLFDFSV